MKSSVKAVVVSIAAAVSTLAVLPLTALPAQADGTPSIEYTGRTPANAGGWNNATVTVQWRCTYADGTAYDISREVSDEGTDQSVTGTCEQPDGSRVQDTQTGIDIDETAPEISFLKRTSANAAGWNKGPVTVTWTCTDDRSGVVSETTSRTVTTEGSDQSVEGTCRDVADNSTTGSSVDRINIDKTAPYVNEESDAPVTRSVEPNDAGWNNTPVTVTWTCGDDMSGPLADTTSATVSTDGEDRPAVGTCVDKAGNTFSPVELIDLDTTAPVITRTERTAPNAAGWNNGPVDVAWSCSDATSGAATTGDGATLTDDGADQSATGTCTDVAGNVATDEVRDVRIDTVAPTLDLGAGPRDAATYFFGYVPARSCQGADALSGLASCKVPGYSGAVGPHTMTGTATDVAGNQTSETRSYTVRQWVTKGFYRKPGGNVAAPGAVTQLRFEVFADREVTNAKLVGARFTQRPVGCTDHKATGGTRTLPITARYVSSTGELTAAWTAPATKGCYGVRATLADGSFLASVLQVK